ncbi:MAG: EcsC family protein [Anaerotignum sp.]|nr:EcsC family protein [Anaerotignum sp.]MBR6542712.1 EcsC family protein [Anaerotignum sp.]
MGTALEKEWKRLLLKEEKMLFSAENKKETKLDRKMKEISGMIEEKIPEKLSATLDAAFYKGFLLIFEKGTGVIEKTFKGEELQLEFQVNDFRVEKKPTKHSLRKVEAAGKKSKLLNAAVTTVEGIGLGVLGVGIPDIPVFLSVLLKGMYEMAASYGYDYNKKEEQILILRMITAGLTEGAEKREADHLVEEWLGFVPTKTALTFEEEVKRASEALSRAMLMAKFVQGLPVVGAAGGMSNPYVYQKVSQYASLKYKKRYLASKRQYV